MKPIGGMKRLMMQTYRRDKKVQLSTVRVLYLLVRTYYTSQVPFDG